MSTYKIPKFSAGNTLQNLSGLTGILQPLTAQNASESSAISGVQQAGQVGTQVGGQVADMVSQAGPMGAAVGGAMKVGQLAGGLLSKAATDKDGFTKSGAGNRVMAGLGDALNPVGMVAKLAKNPRYMTKEFQEEEKKKLALKRQQEAADQAAVGTLAVYGQKGMKIPVFRPGGKLPVENPGKNVQVPANVSTSSMRMPIYKGGGAVILGGLLHAEGGKLGAGNPIVTDTKGKVAETERNELLMSREQTDKLETLIAAGDMVKVGAFVAHIVRRETENKSHDFSV